MDAPSHVLLVCTVGGSPEPVVAALKRWRPVRVRFVHTPQTKETVKRSVQEAAEQGFVLDPGRYHPMLELPDAEDLVSCIDRLRVLSGEVEDWVSGGEGFQVVVDLTGGTKCMSAAIATHASRWPCLLSYVGGDLRTRDGVGVVVSGHERVRPTVNPWDALGHHAVGDFVVLFDQRAYAAAANLAERTKKRISILKRKSEFASLEQLAKALDAWDRFDPANSMSLLDRVHKSANELCAALGTPRGERALEGVTRLVTHLGQLVREEPPSRHHVLDLLANARRRRDEGRFDDAVARLYRAIEAIAQLALKERHHVASTEKVPLETIPEPLRTKWVPRANEGVIALGLQDDYALLAALGDDIGRKFQDAGLSSQTSPLVVRNRSILAHGFDRVTQIVFNKLWTSALSLADVGEQGLPSFPDLAEGRS